MTGYIPGSAKEWRRQMFVEHPDYAEIAQAVAAELGQEYMGVLFSYPDVDLEALNAERYMAKSRLERMQRGFDIIQRKAGTESEEEQKEIADVQKEMHQSMQKLTALIEQEMRTNAPAGGEERRRRRCGGLGSGDPYSVPKGNPKDASPSDLLVGNVEKAASQVALRLGWDTLDWRDLWHNGTQVVRTMFAALIGMNIAEAIPRGHPGRIHDRLKVESARSGKSELLRTFATLEKGADGMYRFASGKGTTGDLDAIVADPIGAALAFASY